MRTKVVHTIATTVVAGCAATMLLAGCSNPLEGAANNLLESGIEKAVEGTSGAEVDLNFDGSGASLPKDWPSDIAVPDGTIMMSISQDGGQVVQISVKGPEALDEMTANLEGAGFSETDSGDLSIMSLHIFERDDLAATASLIDLDGEYVLQVSISPNTN